MMAVKGYFRAPRLHGRKQQQAELYGGESPSAALLDVGDEKAAAVPRVYFAVYAGAEARRRAPNQQAAMIYTHACRPMQQHSKELALL